MESILRNRNIEFLQLREYLTSASILRDEKAIQLVDSIPFNIKRRLVNRWTTMYPKDIFEIDRD